MKATIEPGLVPGLGRGEASLETLHDRFATLYRSADFVALPKSAKECKTTPNSSGNIISFSGFCETQGATIKMGFGSGLEIYAPNNIAVATVDSWPPLSIYHFNSSAKEGIPISASLNMVEGVQHRYALDHQSDINGVRLDKIILYDRVAYTAAEGDDKERLATKSQQILFMRQLLSGRR